MRKAAIGTLVAMLALGACGGKGSKGSKGSGSKGSNASMGPGMDKVGTVSTHGGATVDEVALRFVRAAAKRDVAEAGRCLLGEADCKLLPASQQASCPNYVKQMRASLSAHFATVPKGFVPGKVKEAPNLPKRQGVTFYEVFPKGAGESVGVIVMSLGQRFFVVIPIKVKVRKTP